VGCDPFHPSLRLPRGRGGSDRRNAVRLRHRGHLRSRELLKAKFHLSAGSEGLAVSAVLIGAIVGGIFGGKLADSISRRYALMGLAVLYSVGAIATALAPTLFLFVVFRIVVGVAVGASSMIVPTYIAELAPREIRGGLVILQQLAISAGIFSYVLDYVFFTAGWGWRPMFAAAVIPGIVLAVGMLHMSHTPRWLGMQGRWDEAEQVMKRVNPEAKDEELKLLHEDLKENDRGSF
jgi:MFS family permease